jgi:DNA polymerase-3 subunit alpha
VEAQKAREAGQESLFGDLFGGGDGDTVSVAAIPLPVINESPADKKETLLWEKELLGTNVSEDPVMQALEGIDTVGAISLGQLTEEHIGKKLDFVGVLSGTRKIMTKKGDSMLVGTLEDMQSSIEFVAFPRALEKFKDLLVDDGVVRVTAKVDNRRDALQLMIEAASAPLYRAPAAPPVDPAALNDLLRISVPVGDPAFDDGAPYLGDDGAVPMEALAVAVEALPTTLAELPTHGPSDAYGRAAARPNGYANGSGYANGNGTNGHRAVASNGNGGHAGEPPAAPVSVIRPRAKVTLSSSSDSSASGGGSNGGGGEGGGGNGGRHLRLFLPRSEDFDADVQRMQELDQLLRSTEGDDQVTIYLPEAGGMVLLRPKHMVHAEPALLGGLRELLGEQGVILE